MSLLYGINMKRYELIKGFIDCFISFDIIEEPKTKEVEKMKTTIDIVQMESDINKLKEENELLKKLIAELETSEKLKNKLFTR